ncbi:fumarylacetoacetate hydrolase family protein [Paraglaciecola sp. 2405UD69-4]|uniref:fumarylacetoacetate hydrolase family protein n=1 Tax=Paraglaciecola sp. 2405UD69-4 TaxID=3391836 RepID=UPI0039C93572
MSAYKHIDNRGKEIPLPLGKVVCVGRNYLKHIEELNNEVPSEPLLFMKPATALCSLKQPVIIPKDKGACHNELEVAVLIKSPLSNGSSEEAKNAIWGIGLGLDLTLRDVQSKLKAKGQPWERAKAFDYSCPVSQFIEKKHIQDYANLEFSLKVAGKLRQQGNTKQMIYSITDLIVEISKHFKLMPGDIVMTGTPEGVGPLCAEEQLEVTLENHFSVGTFVI